MNRSELKEKMLTIKAIIDENAYNCDFMDDLDTVLDESIQAVFDEKAEQIQKAPTLARVAFILQYGQDLEKEIDRITPKMRILDR